jgi:hypothetical protein
MTVPASSGSRLFIPVTHKFRSIAGAAAQPLSLARWISPLKCAKKSWLAVAVKQSRCVNRPIGRIEREAYDLVSDCEAE